jgi:hypothetical protein
MVDEINLVHQEKRSSIKSFIIPQIGLGNTFFNTQKYSYRAGLDLGIEYSFKKISLSYTTGLGYESVDNYTYQSYEQTFEKSGDQSLLGTDFQIHNIINWQHSFLIGYQITKLFSLKTGLSYDM